MNKQLGKSSQKAILLQSVILFICVSGILFIDGCRKKIPPQAEKKPIPKKEEPAKQIEIVLRSSLAGRWYPADAQTLSKQIDGFFQKAQVEPIENVIALILPHAGYAYSGQTAACGIKTTDKEYKRIIIIGPSHYVTLEEMLSVPRVTHYETPLGKVPLDVEFINELLKFPIFQNLPQAHEREHSDQIEVPLLQYSKKRFAIVPIVAGTFSQETINKVGAILRSLIDDETLVVASSDFVHYGPNYGFLPFKTNIPQQIKELDIEAYEHIANLDSEGFLEYKQKTGATICGYIPIAILLSMLEMPDKAELIKYETSGAIMGDYTNSVSYLSVAFSGKWEKLPQVKPQHNNPGLTKEDEKHLLALARKSIVYALKHKRIPEVSELDLSISDSMRRPRAAFVTLNKIPQGIGPLRPQLRGCIGDIFPQRPLYKSVIANAINAAFKDRRFYPLTKAELHDVTIEISALTIPEPIVSPNEIRIGIDGVVLSKDGRSAVYLPQVATEQDWDLDTMLKQLSLKAGLPADFWKEDASFLVFQAHVFGER